MDAWERGQSENGEGARARRDGWSMFRDNRESSDERACVRKSVCEREREREREEEKGTQRRTERDALSAATLGLA